MTIKLSVLAKKIKIITASATIFIGANAYAQQCGQGPNRDTVTKKIVIDRYIENGEVIRAKRLLKVNVMKQRGLELQKIVIKAQSHNYNAKVKLIVAGEVVEKSPVDYYMTRIPLKVPKLHGGERIQIKAKEDVYVKAVIGKFKRKCQAKQITRQINKVLTNADGVYKLSNIMNVQSPNKHKLIKSLGIDAKGQGKIILTANGSVLDIINVDGLSLTTTKVRKMASLTEIKIRVRGRVKIKKVSAKI